MGKKIILPLLTVLVSAVITLALAELILRAAGFGPHKNVALFPNVPIMQQPDPVLGWTKKPGHYVYPAFAAGEPEIRMTFAKDGARFTGGSETAKKPGLAIFGCSYAEGEHISDEETLAWKLQNRYSDIKVSNHGVAGYGTYQSLMSMQRVLAQPDPPRKVLYGFMEHHAARNVAHGEWLRLISRASTQGGVAMPYATMDSEGRLVKHDLRAYPQWPLADRLASVAFAQDWTMTLEARSRESQAVAVTHELIREMNELASERQVEFAVVLLYGLKPERKLEYVKYLDEHGIEYYDCQHAKTPELIVPGEGHPNGRLNTLWAQCIARSLESSAPSAWIPRREWAAIEAPAALAAGAAEIKETN